MSNKPIKTFKYGCIRISVWPSSGNDDLGKTYRISARKIYMKDDQWCSMTSFGDYDLASLVLGLMETYLWCQSEKSEHEAAIKLPLLIENDSTSNDCVEKEIKGLKAICSVEPENGSMPSCKNNDSIRE